MTQQTTHRLGDALPFQEDVLRVMTRARSAFGNLIAAHGESPGRPQQVAQAFNIDKSLAWKMVRMIEQGDGFAGAQLMPGRNALTKFLAAASEAKLPHHLIREARCAAEEFESLFIRHGGDRATFDLMLGGFLRGSDPRLEIAHRRRAFEGNSAILGVQAQTTLHVTILQPNAQNTSINFASLIGFFGLKRLRPDVPWGIWRVRHARNATPDRSIEPSNRRPLSVEDVDSALGKRIPLLRRFCSEKLPSLQNVEYADGVTEVEIAPGPVGETAAIDVVLGEVFENLLVRYRNDDEPVCDVVQRIRTPCRHLVHDVIVKRGTFDAPPRFGCYRMFDPDLLPYPACVDDRFRLSVTAAISHHGRGSDFFRSEHVSRYGDLIRFAFDRLGWDPAQFDLYRAHMEYPILHAGSMIRFEMPTAAKESGASE